MTAKPGTTSTADRILDAAIGLMNTKGYNPVSVREIAKAVGLSEMTVFAVCGNDRGRLHHACPLGA